MIDHIVWYEEELGEGIDRLEEMTGVRAAKGGVHAGLGTHNALLALDERCYLEILAPDPAQRGGRWQECLRQAHHPGLFHWAVAVTGLEVLTTTCRVDFLRNRPVVQASRNSPSMGTLRWKLLMPEGHLFGALMPFLIDWEDSPHPARVAPRGCRLRSIEVYTSEKVRLDHVFASFDLNICTAEDIDPHFSVFLDTPRGELQLDSIRPLPKGLTN